jgi:hypothetical protein
MSLTVGDRLGAYRILAHACAGTNSALSRRLGTKNSVSVD